MFRRRNSQMFSSLKSRLSKALLFPCEGPSVFYSSPFFSAFADFNSPFNELLCDSLKWLSNSKLWMSSVTVVVLFVRSETSSLEFSSESILLPVSPACRKQASSTRHGSELVTTLIFILQRGYSISQFFANHPEAIAPAMPSWCSERYLLITTVFVRNRHEYIIWSVVVILCTIDDT